MAGQRYLRFVITTSLLGGVFALATGCDPSALQNLTPNNGGNTDTTGGQPADQGNTGGSNNDQTAGAVRGIAINNVTVDLQIVPDPLQIPFPGSPVPVSLLGGPKTVPVPANQTPGTFSSVLLAQIGGTQIRLTPVVQDSTDFFPFTEYLHSVQFFIWARKAANNESDFIPGLDLDDLLTPAQGGPMDPPVLPLGIRVVFWNINIEDNFATQFTRVRSRPTTQVLFGRYASVLYMRDLLSGGRFYNLQGTQSQLPYTPDKNNPQAITYFTAQVLGQYFFTHPEAYGFQGTPPEGDGNGGSGLGNVNGEFSYLIRAEAFTDLAERQTVLDPVDPIGPGNLVDTDGKVHEIGIACTFETRY